MDAAVTWNNRKAYFFRGSEYIRYDIATDRADPGYPALRAEVVARAEAVQDALFGEHRGRATADTMPNTTVG